ncbi:hypothetical protein [Microbispora rosea]|uniref:hypothetical protein n=1 Tax=Microbispora rosea TaxID=58117 RepID=UPI0037B0D599
MAPLTSPDAHLPSARPAGLPTHLKDRRMNLEPDSIIGWLVSFDLSACGDDLLEALPDGVDPAEHGKFLYTIAAVRTVGCDPQEHRPENCACWDPDYIASILLTERPATFYPSVDDIEDEEIRTVISDSLSAAGH